MGEVRDKHPRRREPNAGEEGHRKHESPTLAQGASKWVGAKQPHAGPQGEHECIVLQASRNPLCPEPYLATACDSECQDEPGCGCARIDGSSCEISTTVEPSPTSVLLSESIQRSSRLSSSLLHLPPAPSSGKCIHHSRAKREPVSFRPKKWITGINGTVSRYLYQLELHGPAHC